MASISASLERRAASTGSRRSRTSYSTPASARRYLLERGGPGLKPEALRAQRVGIGHPEGYQEAFAVLYADAAEAIVARNAANARPPRARLPDGRGRCPTHAIIAGALEFARTGAVGGFQLTSGRSR